jgi:hypothetical protein
MLKPMYINLTYAYVYHICINLVKLAPDDPCQLFAYPVGCEGV